MMCFFVLKKKKKNPCLFLVSFTAYSCLSLTALIFNSLSRDAIVSMIPTYSHLSFVSRLYSSS